MTIQKPVKLDLYSDYGYTCIYDTNENIYRIWYNHYETHLKRLYELFNSYSTNNSLNYHEYIDYDTFCNYIYNNSSKYLSPWI
jgi:hypothetical protein